MIHQLVDSGMPPGDVVSRFAVSSQDMVRSYILQIRPDTCLDSVAQCASWAQQGRCYTDKDHMRTSCRSSCLQCDKQLSEAEKAAKKAGYMAGIEAGRKAARAQLESR